MGSAQRLDVRAVLQSKLGNVADELLEELVLGDEIGLRIDLDDRAASALDGDPDEPFGGGASGLLGGGGETLGAEPIDCGLHLALGFGKRLLAVHHAGAGALAQFLDSRGRNLSHVHSFVFHSGGAFDRPRPNAMWGAPEGLLSLDGGLDRGLGHFANVLAL